MKGIAIKSTILRYAVQPISTRCWETSRYRPGNILAEYSEHVHVHSSIHFSTLPE